MNTQMASPGIQTAGSTGSHRGLWIALIAGLVVLLVLAALGGLAWWGSTPSGTLLTQNLSEPLNGATSARVDINTDAGHLTIDKVTGGEQVLANGTLQYFDSQGMPSSSVNTSNGQANLTLKGGGTGLSSFRFPWAACTGAYEWQVHLNPTVASDITAHTGGGNVKLDLSGMAVTRLAADSGGGNMDVVLPANAANLNATAKTGGGNVTVDMGSSMTGSNTVEANSGAGNVIVHVPSGMAARIHATSGLGQVSVDPRFSKIDNNTYQSSDYATAANKVEITLNSGAGNATVDTK